MSVRHKRWMMGWRALALLVPALLPKPEAGCGEEEDGADLAWVNTSGAVPSDAAVVFDGRSTEMLVAADGGPCKWPIVDGAVVCDPEQQVRQQGLWTKLHFRDAQIHAEFMIPPDIPNRPGAGNSGLYLHGLFEIQIMDSYKKTMNPMTMVGSLYGFRPPMVNAARKPGEWQTCDIFYKAPRRNEKGEPIEAGSVTVLLNGVLVQHETPFTKHVSKYSPLYYRTTPYAVKIRESLLKTECGPLQLQDHDCAVRFRNIWIRPLDGKAFLFEPELPLRR